MSKYEYNPDAERKHKLNHGVAGAASSLAAGGGAAIYGNKATDVAMDRMVRGLDRGEGVKGGPFKHAARNYGHGLKTAHKTKAGKAGIGLAAAGLGGAVAAGQYGKKKGVLVKKSRDVSAFGIQH